MKQKLFFAIVLGVLLFVPGFNVQAQEDTAPLPPPDREGSIFPAADALPPGQAPVRRQTPARAQPPARTQTPVRSQPPARAQTPARSQEPAAPAETPATQQTQAPQQAPAARQTRAPRTPAVLPGKGLFWGGMIGVGNLNSEVAESGGKVSEGMALGGGLFAGYDFGLFAGQVEFLLANDNADLYRANTTYNPNTGSWGTYSGTAHYNGTLLQIPLIVKMDLHLWRFVLQPLAGIYLNFGLGDMNLSSSSSGGDSSSYFSFSDKETWDNPLLGGVVGGTLGLHIGRGFLFLDLRYMGNFGYTKVYDDELYRRSATLGSLGYQYYFK